MYNKNLYYKTLFLIAAIYDLLLGFAFIFLNKQIFSLLKISTPNQSYTLLLGAFVFVLGIAYLLIYKGNLKKNRDLVKVGTLYKFAYAFIAIYTFVIGVIPHAIFFWLFGILDLIFGLLFLECLKSTR